MTDNKDPRKPAGNKAGDSLFISDDVEHDIASDVQSIMNEAEVPAKADDAPAFTSEKDTVFLSADTSDAATPEEPVSAPEEDPLHHDLLSDPVTGEEILADEHAALSAGLSHPADSEVDQILQDAKAMDNTTSLPPTNIDGVNFETTVFDISQMPPIQDYVDPSTPQDSAEEASAEAAAEIPEEPPLPKRRPKMKKGYGLLGIPHILSTVIWLAITLAIGVSLGRLVWICAAEILAFGRPDSEYVLTVTNADNIDTIAAKLKNTGLIKYPELFKLYADLTDAEEEISVGTFTLNTKYDYHALVNAMAYHSPARESISLLIPEGYTCAQIFALLEEKGVCSAAELEEYAANGEIKERWFLEDITRGDKYCLEGYLFPDTYEFYTNDEPGRVIGKFLDNFDDRFTDLMKSRLDPLNERLAKILANRGYDEATIESRKITFRDIVIIASMIEKETANDAESYTISSVIYNRLTNPKNYPFLNIDATVIYALGGNIDPETGKTKPLTSEDLQMEHPYNTYTVKGLIPGPISNPGRNSLNAALDPTETSFYYYVYNPNTSEHMFAKSAAEHERNVNYVKSLKKD